MLIRTIADEIPRWQAQECSRTQPNKIDENVLSSLSDTEFTRMLIETSADEMNEKVLEKTDNAASSWSLFFQSAVSIGFDKCAFHVWMDDAFNFITQHKSGRDDVVQRANQLSQAISGISVQTPPRVLPRTLNLDSSQQEHGGSSESCSKGIIITIQRIVRVLVPSLCVLPHFSASTTCMASVFAWT